LIYDEISDDFHGVHEGRKCIEIFGMEFGE
jgi:hypothetical protein